MNQDNNFHFDFDEFGKKYVNKSKKDRMEKNAKKIINYSKTHEDIIKWCTENIITNGVINITDNLEIEIDGNCIIHNILLEELPYKIASVKGDFKIGKDPISTPNINIKTLKNFPNYIEGNFCIAGCKNLKSLNEGPVYVGGIYKCNNCNITSLDGIATTINGYIEVYGNPLTDISALSKVQNYTTIDLPENFGNYNNDIYTELWNKHKIYIN